MPRYYICDIVGDGRTPETAYRPALQDVVGARDRAFDFTCEIASDERGRPVHPWCVVIAEGDAALVRDVPGVVTLPDRTLDTRLVDTGEAAALRAKFAEMGVTVEASKDTDTLRALVEDLGRQHDATFTIERLKV